MSKLHTSRTQAVERTIAVCILLTAGAVLFAWCDERHAAHAQETSEATREVLEDLDRILRGNPGSDEVQVRLVSADQERLFKLQPTVKISSELIGELKVLLGASCLSA